MPTALNELEQTLGTPRIEESAGRSIVVAGSALAVATCVERGMGFAANLLAARAGGAGVFGGYSLAWTTANNIASYAGGGIGATATRFAGEYNEENHGYAPVARALALVSGVSALLASAILLAGAGLLARYLIRSPQLTYLLRWSALSAGAMILLECCRGFLIGQRQYGTLLILCSIVGASMLAGLPQAAHYGPVAMVITQSGALLVAALVCGVLIRRRVAAVRDREDDGRHRHLVRHIWHFGMVQLAGNVGLNAAGWWMASLIARADTTLVQMGIFAVAGQLRNLAALAPGLLTQGSYGMIARKSDGGIAAHERVLALCSLAGGFTVVLFAGPAIALLPWVLPAFFGQGYRTGVTAGSLALATAIVHMGAGPLAARLTVVSIGITGAINAVWSVLVAVLAAFAISNAAATQAMAVYFVAHLLSACLTAFFVWRAEGLPRGMLGLTVAINLTAIAMAFIALGTGLSQAAQGWRAFAVLGLAALSLGIQFLIAKRSGWVPEKANWIAVLRGPRKAAGESL